MSKTLIKEVQKSPWFLNLRKVLTWFLGKKKKLIFFLFTNFVTLLV